MRFRLVGINNQNFIMGDEETGTWWQQVSGRAILGPLKGRQLRLVPADIVSFATWRADHPSGRVLAPDPEVETRDEGDYLSTTWERQMATTKTVTTLPKGSPFAARQLVVGVRVDGVAKAWSLDDLRAARVHLDVVGATPLMIVVGEDGTSLRVFDRRIGGREAEFAALVDPGTRGADARTVPGPHLSGVPGTVSDVAPGLRAPSSGTPRRSAMFIDVDTGSEWDFAGRATSGPLQGRTLARIPHLVEYWFDWQTYQPKTLVYKPWNPVKVKPDPLTVPRPTN